MEIPQARTPRERQLEQLFDEWVSMPAERRSYGALAKKHEGVASHELLRHARQFLWPERLSTLQIRHNEDTATDTDDPGAAEINRLHLTRLKLLQKKAMEYLESCVFDKPEAAMRTLIEAMKLEREIKGLTRDKVDDLRSILLGRIAEAQAAPPVVAGAPEFEFDPQYVPPALPDGNEGNPAPPSGGDHAQ